MVQTDDLSVGGLPREVGDGLILRWATAADAEALAQFNMRIHSDNPDELEEGLLYWTRDLMSGRHPTTGPDDVTLVVDQRAGGQIVSSVLLISQTWSYDGIALPVGRPELVATDAAYRRRGLIRAQFEAIHAKSAARGELVLGITGIPWYYRQFGYAMALDLGGSRDLPWRRVGELPKDGTETYRLRPAAAADIPLLAQLYDFQRGPNLVSRVRAAAEWGWEMHGPHQKSFYHRMFEIVENADGSSAGYVETSVNNRGSVIQVRELAAARGQSLRAICGFLSRALRARAEELNKKREKPLTGLTFDLGAAHPAYEALGEALDKQTPPYAWYVRVPDLPAFVRHIAPALERRLVGSVVEGHSGTLRLNFYRSHLTMVFEKGTLREAGTYQPKWLSDGDACFPDLTFLQLLFGHRSLADLRYAHPDCYVDNTEAAVLLRVLFPQRPSFVNPLG